MSKLTEIRTLYGDFARDYKFEFSIEIPDSSSTLKALASNYASLEEKLTASCVSCTLPNSDAEKITLRVGLHMLRVPGKQETAGNITPKFIVSGDYSLYKFFRAWKDSAASDQNDVQVRHNLLLANIIINQKDVENNITNKCKLINVWCDSCPSIDFSDDASAIVQFSPSLSYDFVTDPDKFVPNAIS